MPSTINGIGTRYVGRKNVAQRPGECPNCHRRTQLESYDTRLWFVVIFIPIIPLGRKRIIDYCPACRRHYVMELKKWEEAKQLEISDALNKFRTDPTPESGIAVHQRLLQFHQYDQAETFRETLREKFADNAKVHLHLALVLEHLGRTTAAEVCFARALELRPDMPEARAGVAGAHIRHGRLEEAHKLLDFLEKPGAVQLYPLSPLEDLGNAYQRAGRHAEALEIYRKLLEAIPSAAQHAGFRKKVKASEKALGKKDSLLPGRKFSFGRILDAFRPRRIGSEERLGWWIIFGGVVVLMVALVISNEYIRHHRTLHVVADFNEPVKVEVKGVGSLTFQRGVRELPLSEGKYHASIGGRLPQEVDFELQSSYLDRWFESPVWVLNAGSSAILVLQDVSYSQNPAPATVTLYFGHPFESFRNLSYPFKELPASVQAKSGETVRYSHLEMLNAEPVDAFSFLENRQDTAGAMRLAEVRLQTHPDDESMLSAYLNTGYRTKQMPRMEAYLHAGLTNRPVVISWHRYYQSLRRDRQRDERLIAEYDAQLAADPQNSALLYLCGRISPSHADGLEWFKCALKADASNPYPYFAMAYDLASAGNWAQARALAQRAADLRPDNEQFSGLTFECRMAQGEFAGLERELQAQQARTPLNYFVVGRLCDVFAAQQKTSEAVKIVEEFEREVKATKDKSAREIISVIHGHLLYAIGDLTGLEQYAGRFNTAITTNQLFNSLIEQGRPAEAVKLHPLNEASDDLGAYHFLTVSLAWRKAQDATQAEAWLARAVQLLGAGDADDARAAALLMKAAPPTDDELAEVVSAPHLKAVLLATLAAQHPERRAELSAAARRLNVEQSYPYHLIQSSTAVP